MNYEDLPERVRSAVDSMVDLNFAQQELMTRWILKNMGENASDANMSVARRIRAQAMNRHGRKLDARGNSVLGSPLDDD